MIYVGITYFANTVIKWRRTFEYYLLVCFVCLLVAASAPAPVIAIVPFTNMYAMHLVQS